MAPPGDRVSGREDMVQRVGKRTAKFAIRPHLLCAVPSVQALNGSSALAKQTHVETRLSGKVYR